MKEPTLLPSRFPNILVNANQGIAVGMASNICGFNLGEVCDGVISFLENDNQKDILEHIKAPDFSTGGDLIYDSAEMKHILKTGKGSFKVRAKYTILKKENCIEITEIPYTTTVEAIIDKIEDLVKAGKIKEITDVRDETDLKGLKLTIYLKRGTDTETLMIKLFKMTPLQDSFSCNFNVLINGYPKVLGVAEILKEWCDFRKNCIVRKYKYNIAKLERRHHLLLGLSAILVNIDKAIALIRNTEKETDVIPSLMTEFDITALQADFIAEIRLRNLNKQYILRSLKEVTELERNIKKFNSIINSEDKLKKIIIDDLNDIKKKYNIPRKTRLIDLPKEEVEELVKPVKQENYEIKIFMTRDQYFKKMPLSGMQNKKLEEMRIKENDKIIFELQTNNHVELLLFSDKAKLYKLKMSELDNVKFDQLGHYLPNLLEMEEREKIIYICPNEDNYQGTILVGFRDGRIAKIPLSLYITKTNRKRLLNAYYGKSDCIGIIQLKENEQACLIRIDGKKKYFKLEDLEFVVKRDSPGKQIMVTTKKLGINQLIVYNEDKK
ncbi:hypothetical protein AN643_02580 [Candidatus Epulonipiscioides saccharophilum]|nr:hypothetical protein AN643_02580 [Epulopiscium sp. SCG-B10WGA-EpuloB]